MRTFIQTGLIALDTNALFDIYRLNGTARVELLDAFHILKDRLWIPHQVAEEFLKGRLGVIAECSTATEILSEDLKKTLVNTQQQLQEFGNRRGLPLDEIEKLKSRLHAAFDGITTRINELFEFELTIDKAIRQDHILTQIENLLEGKIGAPLENLDTARTEGLRRIRDQIPPGFEDGKKDPERAVGDYLLWAELISEAKERAAPVVLVSNEQKKDWINEDQGKKLGPRLELVNEMLTEARCPFYMLTVRSFLIQARKFLGATVSEATVAQAEQLRESKWVSVETVEIGRIREALNSTVFHLFFTFLHFYVNRVHRGLPVNFSTFLRYCMTKGWEVTDVIEGLHELRREGALDWGDNILSSMSDIHPVAGGHELSTHLGDDDEVLF